MSDGKAAEYYPPPTDPFPGYGFRPCLKCGAMIHKTTLGLHVDWHERQRSTERLILDNQTPRADPRWKVGDSALMKPMNSGYLYIGAEEAERLGLRAGTDGWSIVGVVDDGE